MLTDNELREALDAAVHEFLMRQIESKSLARKIGEVRVFDRGSNFVVEREGQVPVKIETKEITAKAVLRNEYLKRADFEMVKAFFESLANQIADAETSSILETLKNNAGVQIDAKGDILGGLIESLEN